jgi:hypothetical protein
MHAGPGADTVRPLSGAGVLDRRLVLVRAAPASAGVVAAFVLLERPGLGIAHGLSPSRRATCVGASPGRAAVDLFRKADDRLFAAKLLNRNRRTVARL